MGLFKRRKYRQPPYQEKRNHKNAGKHSGNNDAPNHINNTQHAKRGQEMQNRLLFSRRVVVLLFAVVSGMVGLLARAQYLQVNQHHYYRTRSRQNRVKLQVVPPLRGNIFDRHGVALSENILSYDLVVNRAKSDNIDQLVKQVADYMAFDDDDWERYTADKKKKNYNQDVVVRSDLSDDEIHHFVVDLHKFPGFEVVPSYKRYYPHGDLTAHVVGYINNINKKDLASLDPREYSGTTKIGRTGIEKEYESELHGQAGFRQAEMSRTGKVVRVLEQIDPVPGQDLYLSLDLSLQRAIRDILEAEEYNGAGVAIDPRSGEMLAMYSNPSFDANLFVNGISHKAYSELRNSPRKNLFNRALNGSYSPASTIKPMMALAALHEYIVTPEMTINCGGSYRIPEYESTKRFFCWKRSGHGDMNAADSIIESCDVYYYNVGKELGIARIHAYLSQFGMGHKTGIDLPNESPGILPDKAWKQQKYNKSWFIGDTINASIGQGYMLTTPVQMAYFAAILGARGKRFHPHFVTHYRNALTGERMKKSWPRLQNVVQSNPNAWALVDRAMIDVMVGKNGTARKVKVNLPFAIAGKTGTAQVFSFRNNKRIKKEDLAKELRDNSVFVAYAPAENPVIAIAVILENAGGGSEIAAPIAVNILERYFNQMDNQPPAESNETTNDEQVAQGDIVEQIAGKTVNQGATA